MTAKSESITYPFADYPAAGTATEVADGILWISTPVPFVGLRQVNLWFVRDGDGWTQIDCGFRWEQTQVQLETTWSKLLGGKPVKRLIVTHFHPDHAGNMAFIADRWNGLLPRMSLGEWFAANIAFTAGYSDNIKQREAWHVKNGLDDGRNALFVRECIPYHDGVTLPGAFRRLRGDDLVRIGNDDWRVLIGEGHSPEHVSLYCEARRILIAGDQILPQITTNVSTWPMEPELDTLATFLDTAKRFRGVLHADTLVLPSHRKPFYGVQHRLRELSLHHAVRLNKLLDDIGNETTAGDLLDVLFKGKLDGHQIGFAMGEALAHLNHLVELGRMTRELGRNGVWTYRKVSGAARPVDPHF